MDLPKLTPPNPKFVQNFILPTFWAASNEAQLESKGRAFAENLPVGVHFADSFLSWGFNNSMLDDAHFVTAWRNNLDGSQANATIIWRRYILACAAYHAIQLDGDFVECGCYTGAGVKTVVDYLGGKAFPKPFWAYDLFEHAPGEIFHAMPDHGAGLHGRVLAKFDGYANVHIVRGRIPEVLIGQSPERIAYLHIDLNQAPAEIAALDHLFDRVVPGGIVILDDYEWTAYRSQKLAEDPWFEARSYRVFPLPTGQGIVLKR